MKLARLEIKPYRLPLAKPIAFKGSFLRERSGALVRVISETGAEGWGDCAPLPGFSRESIEDALRDLSAMADSIGAIEIRSFDELAAWSLAQGGLSPSVRFALESALAGAAAREAGESIARWLIGAEAARCELQALAVGGPDSWPEAAHWAAADKFRALKIKVGRATPSREVAALFEASAAAPTLRFRLDANRAWPEDVALAFAKEVGALPIDFLEEPFREGFHVPSAWPSQPALARDESLWAADDPSPPAPPVAAWVLKPTLLGGLIRAIRLALRARRAGCEAVWSSSYESGVGIRILAELAGAMGGLAGLDTLRAFAEDLLDPPLVIADGALDLIAARRSVIR